MIQWASPELAIVYDRLYASSIPAHIPDATSPLSRTICPKIAPPDGLDASSFNLDALSPVCNIVCDVDDAIFEANFMADARGKPSLTAPSAIALIK